MLFQKNDTQVSGTKKNKALLLLSVILIVAVITAGLLFIRIRFFPGQNDSPASGLLLIQQLDRGYIYADGNKPFIINGAISDTKYTMDGEALAACHSMTSLGSTLSYCDGSDLFVVAENVYDFIFSASGNKIMYTKNYRRHDKCFELYVYDVKTRQSTMIIDNAYAEFAISPDGESIAYATVDNPSHFSEHQLTGYVRIADQTAEPLGQDKVAFAVSDQGEYIYYLEDAYDLDSTVFINENNTLFVRHEKTDMEIGRNVSYQRFYLNRDYSEILIRSGKSLYISIKGAEEVKLADGLFIFEMVVPEDVKVSFSGNTTLVDVQTFRDQLFILLESVIASDHTLLYVKKDLSGVQKFCDYDDSYSMSSDGKALYFIDGKNELAYFTDYRNWLTDSEKILSDEAVKSFVVMPDQSAVYFVDYNNDLWVARGTEDLQKIDSCVDERTISLSNDGKGINYLADIHRNPEITIYEGDFFYVANEDHAKPVMIAEKVCNFTVSDYGTVYYVCEKIESYQEFGTAYLSRSGNTYTKLLDEVYVWGEPEMVTFD